jgi:nickel-type superoxide dismutase maturation protease
MVEGRQTTAVGWIWRTLGLTLMKVTGTSMEPTLRAGQLVLVVRKQPKINDVVVARHPENDELIIKRLTKIEADGMWLEGDAHTPETAASSSDSWVFGAVKPEAVLGVAYKL